jgi:hypothetical protein
VLTVPEGATPILTIGFRLGCSVLNWTNGGLTLQHMSTRACPTALASRSPSLNSCYNLYFLAMGVPYTVIAMKHAATASYAATTLTVIDSVMLLITGPYGASITLKVKVYWPGSLK